MKKFIAAAALAMTSMVAQAEITGNFSLTNDYRFRGISQTQGAMAIQGGFDYAHSSGFYLGNWNSSVSSQVYLQGSGVESDVYVGFTKPLGPVTFDVGAIAYFYPNARTGSSPSRFDTQEVYLGAAVGPFSARVSQSLTDYFGTANSDKTNYYQLGADIGVTDNLSVNAHYGRTKVQNHAVADYDDYKVGATLSAAGFDWGLHYYGTVDTTDAFRGANTVDGKRNYDDAVVLSLTRTF